MTTTQPNRNTHMTPDQLTIRTVADFLRTVDGPVHITTATAHTLAAIFDRHGNLDNDQPRDNQVILNAAKAFDIDPGCNEIPAQPITAEAIAGPTYCFGCVVERHQGQRETPNPAETIVGGQATCLEHLKLVDGPVLPGRTPGGIILGNGS